MAAARLVVLREVSSTGLGPGGTAAGPGDAPSDAEILSRSPLCDQLLVAHQPITAAFVGLDAVLLAQSGELLPQGVEDGMVVVQGSGANDQTLTESEDPLLFCLGCCGGWEVEPADATAIAAPRSLQRCLPAGRVS